MLFKSVGEFLADPFDPNQDGHTSAVELVAALGLVALITYAWSNFVLKHVFE